VWPRAVIALALVALAAAALPMDMRARAQTRGGHHGPDTTTPQTERDAWTDPRKAGEVGEHVKAARERVDALRARLKDEKTPWCPSTRDEWVRAIDDIACYLAVQHLWKGHIKKGPLKAEFDGKDLGKDIDKAFDGYKDIRDEIEAKLRACDRTNAPTAPDVAITAFAAATGTEAYLLRRIAEKTLTEWRSFGLAETALVLCKDEKCPKRLAVVPGGGR
jgi:hypothetical protein